MSIKRLQNDYFVMFCSIFILGLFIALYIPTGYEKILIWPPIILWFISLKYNNRILISVALVIASLLSGVFYGNLRRIPIAQFSDLARLDDTTAMLTAKINGDYKYTKNGIAFEVNNAEVREIDDKDLAETYTKIPGRILCYINNKEIELLNKHIYNLKGKFSVYLPDQSVRFIVETIEDTNSESLFVGFAGKVGLKIREVIVRYLPERYAGVIVGFVLGDTSLISKEDKSLFRETGISHLLAISGQHIMIIILLLASFLHFLNIPPVSRIILISILLSFYAFVTVGSPSVWRAIIMYLSAAVSLHLEVKPSPLRPVSIASFLILLYDPNYLTDVAFILSFSAVLGIIIFSRPINVLLHDIGLPAFISRYLSVSFAANIGTVPIGTYFFGAFSTASLVVNPLILWAFAYIIPMSFLLVAVSMFNNVLGIYIFPIIRFTLDAFFFIISFFANIAGQYVYVGNMPAFVVALIYCFLFLLASLLTKAQIVTRLRRKQSKKNKLVTPLLISTQDEENNHTDKILTNEDDGRAYSLKPPARMFYPLKSAEIMTKTDEILCSLRRPFIKDFPENFVPELPINELRLENQNLYYQIKSLNEEQLKSDYDKILQSQVFIMSLTGSEFLPRIIAHLNPVTDLKCIKPRFNVKDKNLEITLTTDSMLYSSLLTRTKDRTLIMLISKFQNLYSRGYNQFERIMQQSDINETVEVHLLLRKNMLEWCKNFIEYDISLKKRKTEKLRPLV